MLSCPAQGCEESAATAGLCKVTRDRRKGTHLVLGTAAEAIGTFAVTNVDDLVVLAVFFGQAAGHRDAIRRIVTGQYLGFTALLAASVVTAVVGETLLPHKMLAYFGFVPIILGLYTGFRAWRERRTPAGNKALRAVGTEEDRGPSIADVAVVTFTNGGDNIGVYVPIFAVETVAGISVFVAVFLVGVAVYCLVARYLASDPLIARSLARRNDIVLPVVLIGIGIWILIEGGAFGL
jgi:cadmium resistance protein CadD (predicted permease)